MTLSFNNPKKQSLLFNILLVVGGVLIVNSLIFTFEWSTNSLESATNPVEFSPPGWVVGIVWTIWFFGLAISRWILGKSENFGHNSERILVDILIISCLLYPLYSLAIGSVIGGLIGNFLTLFLTIYVFIKVLKKSKVAAWLIFPIIPWLIFATIITLAEVGLL